MSHRTDFVRVRIDKKIESEIDVETEFEFEAEVEIEKEIEVEVDLVSYVDLEDNVATNEFYVQNTSDYRWVDQFSDATTDDYNSNSFTEIAVGRDYPDSFVVVDADADGYDTFSEVTTVTNVYDDGYTISGSALAATE